MIAFAAMSGVLGYAAGAYAPMQLQQPVASNQEAPMVPDIRDRSRAIAEAGLRIAAVPLDLAIPVSVDGDALGPKAFGAPVQPIILDGPALPTERDLPLVSPLLSPSRTVSLAFQPLPPKQKPDVGVTLGRDLSAVVRSAKGPELVLVGAGTSRRRLGLGDDYRDGWKLKRVEGQAIILMRGHDERRVIIGSGIAESAAVQRLPTARYAGPPSDRSSALLDTSEGTSVGIVTDPNRFRPRRVLSRPSGALASNIGGR
jgi:hypothetical protein